RDHCLLDSVKQTSLIADLLFATHTFAYVAGNFCGTDYVAVFVFQRRYRQRDINQAFIFTLSDSFIMVDTFALEDLSEDRRLIVKAFMRNQDSEGLALSFGSRVAKDMFGTFIPADDDSLQVGADYGIVRRLDDRCQQRCLGGGEGHSF